MIISKPPEGTTYGEVLRHARAKVDLAGKNIQISRMKTTAAGELMLEVTGEGKAADLQEMLAPVCQELKTEVRRPQSPATVIVLDIDQSVDAEELGRVLTAEAGGGEVKVSEIRAGTWGQRSARVTLPVKCALALVEKKRVAVGWTMCRVRALEDSLRCFKCRALST